MKRPEVCSACGQPIPLPVGKLICSACALPIRRGHGGWTHGADGRPRHKDCSGAQATSLPEIMQLVLEDR